MRKTVKNTFWYALPFLVRNVIPLLSLPFFTRYLSPEDYGDLALSVIYAVLFVGILNLGLITIFERNYFEQETDKDRYQLMWTCLLFVGFFLGCGAILTYQLEEISSKILFQKQLPKGLISLSFIHLGAKSLLQYFYISLRNANRATPYAIISTLEALLCVFLSVYFVFDQKGIMGFVQGQAFGVCLLLCFLGIKEMLNRNISFNFRLLSANLNLSLPLTPRVFFGVINTQFDRYMLGIIGTQGGVGIYDIAQKIANIGFLFSTVLQQVFAPQVYNKYFQKPEQFSKDIGVYLAPFFFVSLLFSFVLGLFGQEIIFLLTAPAFYDAYPVVIILNMLYVTYFFGKQPQLLLAKKVKLIAYLSFLSLVLNIAINIPLIHLYGVIGAAWGTYISGMAASLCSFYFAQKFAKIDYYKSIYFNFGFFQLAMFVLVLLWYYEVDYTIVFIYKISCLIIFISLAFKSGLINSSFFRELTLQLKNR